MAVRQGWTDGAWIAVKRANQKAHVLTKRQANVVLHLLVLVTPQGVSRSARSQKASLSVAA
jgi:hypothetical protein